MTDYAAPRIRLPRGLAPGRHWIPACLGLLLVLGADVGAQQRRPDPLEQAREAFRDAMERVMIPTARLTDGPQVRAAFREAVAEAVEATVEVRAAGEQVALGGIVGSDGWVVTKASQVEGPVTCHIQDGREFEARLVGVDPQYDLAMLKIDASGLPVLPLARNQDPQVGKWVATIATQRDPISVGVVSVETRRIRPQRGWLGIQLDISTTDPRVTMVYEGSGAEAAGLQVNDLIVQVNDEPTPTREKLIRTVAQYAPGDVIDLVVERAGEQRDLQAVLTPPVKGMPTGRSDFQNSLGTQLSERRSDFPGAFQHDTVLRVDNCGGPLVDLDGRVIGFNIARSGRTESYAIPSQLAVERFFDLMSGNLAPADRLADSNDAAEDASPDDGDQAAADSAPVDSAGEGR